MGFKRFFQESLEDNQIFKFYALNYILHAGNKQTFEDWELEQVHDKYVNVKDQIWKDICAEGISACIGEAGHIESQANAVSRHAAKKMNGFIEFKLDKNKHDDDVVGGSLIEWFSETCSEFRIDAREYKKRGLEKVKEQVKMQFGSNINDVLAVAKQAFEEMDWAEQYGGESWARITDEVLGFYNKGARNVSTNDIDHLLDLAHNTGSWLNKFTYSNDVRGALKKKFKAETPHEWKRDIHDQDIKKWVGKALVGTPKIDPTVNEIEYNVERIRPMQKPLGPGLSVTCSLEPIPSVLFEPVTFSIDFYDLDVNVMEKNVDLSSVYPEFKVVFTASLKILDDSDIIIDNKQDVTKVTVDFLFHIGKDEMEFKNEFEAGLESKFARHVTRDIESINTALAEMIQNNLGDEYSGIEPDIMPSMSNNQKLTDFTHDLRFHMKDPSNADIIHMITSETKTTLDIKTQGM